MMRPGTCTPPKHPSHHRLHGTVTPPMLRSGIGDEPLGDSWVDMSQNLGNQSGLSSSTHSMHTTGILTPPLYAVSEEYLKLLRDAQRESNQSSALVSLASSRRDSLHGSPGCKSPPNSPNTELSVNGEEMKGVFVNGRDEVPKDWIWDWSSRPNIEPPKEWKFKHPRKRGLSMRYAKVGKQSLFSKEVLYTLMLTNVLTFFIGATFGWWLNRRKHLASVGLM